jgi:23S rRNA (cytosine1962-C5)-methyltransferase
MENDKTRYQAEIFANRLKKRYAQLKKWAKRCGVTCYRLYDRDIPEIPLAVDLYTFDSYRGGAAGVLYAHLYLYERPYEKDEAEETAWLAEMKEAVSNTLAIPPANVVCKVRRRQHGDAQYEAQKNITAVTGIIREQELRFFVDLTSYLDTGIFFDHRPLRSLVRSSCAGKRVLNLFCYTGSFSVYAASGGAASVDSVDMSNTYLDIAAKNMRLNGFCDRSEFSFIRSDVFTFLTSAAAEKRKWDIIILDPPTFSNSKKMHGVLDINTGWPELVASCLELLNTQGILYFSTNSKMLKFDKDKLPIREGTRITQDNLKIEDITTQTIPLDFAGKRPHRVWRLTL